MKTLKKLMVVCLTAMSFASLTSCGGDSSCSHTYGNWTVSKKATCEETGEKTRTCTKCGDVQKKEIPAMGHNYVNGICTVCGKAE